LKQHQPTSLVIRIKRCTIEPKLRDLDYSIIEVEDAFKQFMLKLLVLTSVRKENYPSGIEKQFLIKMIKEKYGMFTMDEISHAFELAMTRELLPYMAKNDSVKHFGEFTLDYFGGVMNGFKNYKNKIMQLELNKRKPIKEVVHKKGSELEWYNKMLFSGYAKLLNNETHFWNEQLESFLFSQLEKMGVIKLTISEKKDIKSDVLKSIDRTRIKDKEMLDLKIKTKCKSRCFKIWIQEQQFNEVDITKIITPHIKD